MYLGNFLRHLSVYHGHRVVYRSAFLGRTLCQFAQVPSILFVEARPWRHMRHRQRALALGSSTREYGYVATIQPLGINRTDFTRLDVYCSPSPHWDFCNFHPVLSQTLYQLADVWNIMSSFGCCRRFNWR